MCASLVGDTCDCTPTLKSVLVYNGCVLLGSEERTFFPFRSSIYRLTWVSTYVGKIIMLVRTCVVVPWNHGNVSFGLSLCWDIYTSILECAFDSFNLSCNCLFIMYLLCCNHYSIMYSVVRVSTGTTSIKIVETVLLESITVYKILFVLKLETTSWFYL